MGCFLRSANCKKRIETLRQGERQKQEKWGRFICEKDNLTVGFCMEAYQPWGVEGHGDRARIVWGTENPVNLAATWVGTILGQGSAISRTNNSLSTLSIKLPFWAKTINVSTPRPESGLRTDAGIHPAKAPNAVG